MKITLNDKELDNKIEHDLVNLKGYGVDVKYHKNSPYTNESFENITEVHYLYKSPLKEKRVALESDIDSTGWTRDLKEIVSIKIKDQKN